MRAIRLWKREGGTRIIDFTKTVKAHIHQLFRSFYRLWKWGSNCIIEYVSIYSNDGSRFKTIKMELIVSQTYSEDIRTVHNGCSVYSGCEFCKCNSLDIPSMLTLGDWLWCGCVWLRNLHVDRVTGCIEQLYATTLDTDIRLQDNFMYIWSTINTCMIYPTDQLFKMLYSLH